MAASIRLGFISPTSTSSPHMDSFQSLLPAGVELQRYGLGYDRGALYRLEGALEPLLERMRDLTLENSWQAVIASGAPFELMNPALPQRLRETLPVPSTTALSACTAALHALGVRRVVLMTPFDDAMNARLRDHLAGRGIETAGHGPSFATPDDALQLGPERVRELTREALAAAQGAQGIYFQGAVLDPIPVLEQLEEETGLPIVASNPAMLWAALSQLGRRYAIEGGGRLLREWPAS